MENNNWSFERIIALLSLLVATVTLIVSVIIPEVRKCIGFKENTAPPTPVIPAPPLPQPDVPHVQKKPIKLASPQTLKHEPVTQKQLPAAKAKLPFPCVLHENEPQPVELADAYLSFSVERFKKESIISLHIAPNGRPSSNHAVWTGDSAKFSSAAGNFLVSILSVNADAKTISVQVSKAQ
ncbi:hypothetical protein [Candidatus Electronema sp. TJ]|uniref:hypothetical protein n=1 Tax=Candidatus Electronema sp. TJ TaxID=3401573 RepID=UPI003AA9C049